MRIRTLASHFAKYGQAEKEAYFGSGENPNTWIANMSPHPERIEAGVERALRAYFESAYAEYRDRHDRIGFKEVRYGRPELELLKACYPDAAIVLIVRHPVPAWKSAAPIWEHDADAFARTWNERAVAYAELADPGRGIHLIRYEDLIGRDEATLALLADLAGIGRRDIDSVLNVPLNSTRAERDGQELERIRRLCREGMNRLGYAE